MLQIEGRSEVSRFPVLLTTLVLSVPTSTYAQSARKVPTSSPDCSFRSPTTCWNAWGNRSASISRSRARPEPLTAPRPVLAADSLRPPRLPVEERELGISPPSNR
jgi:hypothetical protein